LNSSLIVLSNNFDRLGNRILNESVAIYESVASWRGPLYSDLIFSPDDCWALRRGRAHIVDHESTPDICNYIASEQLHDVG